MKRYAISILFAAVVTMSPSWAQQRTLEFQNGFNGYEGTEDAFVMSGAPDQNTNFQSHPEGNRFQTEWDGSDSGGRNLGLFKFNQLFGDGPNQVPLGAQIVSARLETIVANAGSSSQASTISNLLLEWDQETVTFNRLFNGGLGSFEDPLPGSHVSETSVRVFHAPAGVGGVWSGDITELVQEWSDGLENNGFVIVPDENSTNGFGHLSSETPISEPITRLTVEAASGRYVFENGVNGYDGVKDTWVGNNNNRYFTNYGSNQTMQLERNSEDDVELGLLRFDDMIGIGANQIPEGDSITSAQLTLWVQDGGNAVVYVNEILPHNSEVLGVEIDTFFDEDSVTFETFVEDGVYPQFGVEIGEEPVAQFTPEAFSTVDIDVTPSLQKWSSGQAPNYGWLFEATSGAPVNLSASEGGERFGPPKLVVTFIAETSIDEFMIY